MSDILVIGSSMYDLVTFTDRLPQAGETLEGNNFHMGFGGKGANQAISAAKLGGKVSMLTGLGDDDFGKMTYQNFAENGVNTDFIKVIPNQPSGIATIIVDETAQNRILIVKGANDYLTKKDVDEAFEKLPNIQIVVLQLEINLDIVYYAIKKAKQRNITVLLNPAPAIKLDMDIISQVDILVPNETELEILTAMPVNTIEEIKAAGQSLLQKGIKNMIITLGSKGSLYMSDGISKHFPAPKVNAVDTTGAGDGFIGSFTVEYINHKNIDKAIEFAIQYASRSTTFKGAQSAYLKRSEL